jgi:hypothetical protein
VFVVVCVLLVFVNCDFCVSRKLSSFLLRFSQSKSFVYSSF